MLLLTDREVRALLPLPELIDEMERALVAFSSGRARQPLRTSVEVGPERNAFFLMPASLESPAALGAKLVTVFHGNAQRNLPTHHATVVLLDPETGETLAVMDGRSLTALRTAAVSAVSARHLARPGAAALGILGSGVQARSHVAVLRHVREFREARAWSPTRENLARFAGETGVDAADSPEEAVRGADVVVLAASSTVPVIQDRWVKAGAHVISLGAYRPEDREMDPALVTRARLIVDSRQGSLAESGDIVQGIREGRFDETHVAGELGEVAAGRVAGRRLSDEVTIFKSLGMAVEDVAAAHLAYRRARLV